MLYTLEFGEVVSKRSAVKWAEEMVSKKMGNLD
jgi:hypothetical protein